MSWLFWDFWQRNVSLRLTVYHCTSWRIVILASISWIVECMTMTLLKLLESSRNRKMGSYSWQLIVRRTPFHLPRAVNQHNLNHQVTIGWSSILTCLFSISFLHFGCTRFFWTVIRNSHRLLGRLTFWESWFSLPPKNGVRIMQKKNQGNFQPRQPNVSRVDHIKRVHFFALLQSMWHPAKAVSRIPPDPMWRRLLWFVNTSLARKNAS